MIPESVRAEIEAHGGLASTEGPDANGITTYRAADGSYVNVGSDGQPRMRGFVPPQDGAQSTTPSVPAAAPASSDGGGGMNQQQVEQWLRDQGGPDAVQYNRSTKTIDNPASDPLTAKAAGVTFNPTAPAKITVTEESWTNSKTGATLRVSRNPDNSFDVLENKTADPNKPATATTGRPAGATDNIEGTPDASKPGGADNERPIYVTRGPDGRVIDSKPLTPAQMDEWRESRQRSRNPGGKTDADIEKDAATARSNRASELSALKPGTTISTIAGRKYTTIVTPSTTPGGQPTVTHLGPDNKPIAALPPEPPESTSTAITRNGQTFIQTTTKTPEGTSSVTFTDTAGKPVTELPREGATALPEGMPELDTSSPQAARDSYLAQVRWAQQQQRAGKMTTKEVVDLLNPSVEAAQTVIDAAQKDIENARSTRGQDITQEGNRATAAGNFFSNAQTAVNDVWKVAPAGGTQSADVLLGSILLQQLLGRSPTGQAGAAPVPGAPAVAPLPAPGAAAAEATPNAIGPGAVPSSIVPAVGALTPAAAAASVGPERAAEIAANPVFRPSPAVAPGLPPGAPPVRDDWRHSPGSTPVNPPPGQPGHDPTLPVGQQMPPSVNALYGRSLVDSIMSRYGAAV